MSATHSRAHSFLDHLRRTYPVFSEPRPMAVGLHATVHERHGRRADQAPELAEGQERPSIVREALKLHAGSREYLEAVAAGGTRYDLDGNPAGEVTGEHQEHARQQLQALKDRQQKRGGKKVRPKDAGQKEAKEAPAQEVDAGEAPNDGKIRLKPGTRRRRRR